MQSKIHILTCFYKRPEVTRIFLEGIRRLQSEFNISYTFVCSLQEDIDFIESEGFKTYLFANEPLSNKWNFGLNTAMRTDFDELLILGSDDLISNEGIKLLLNCPRSYRGFGDIYFYHIRTKEFGYFSQSERLIGAGRMIRKDALESVLYKSIVSFRKDHVIGGKSYTRGEKIVVTRNVANYLLGIKYVVEEERINNNLWNNGLMSSLDHSSEMNLCVNGFSPYFVKDDRVHLLDIKSDVVVTQWVNLMKKGEVRDWDCWYLSDKEKSILFSL